VLYHDTQSTTYPTNDAYFHPPDWTTVLLYLHQLESVSCAMALLSLFYILFFSPFYRVQSAKDWIHFMTNSARQIFTMTTVGDDFDVSTSLTDSFHLYFVLSLPSFSWHLHYIRSGSSPVWVRSHPLSFTPQSSTII